MSTPGKGFTRVVTLNVNGIRSAAKKGFFRWLSTQDADVVCLQEIKAQLDQLKAMEFWPPGYHCYYHSALKKGYAGVALFSKQLPVEVIQGFGWLPAEEEGRYLEANYGHLSVASVYVPSGTSGDERQAFKYEFMDRFLTFMRQCARSGRDYIFCGDFNIAHKKIDIKNWRSNQKRSGFLPEERAWLDQLFDQEGWIDAFRVLNQEPDQYTWWSNRGRAWEKNVGWRIDYQIVSPSLKDRIRRVKIYKQERFSDHAPLIVDYDLLL